MHAYDGPFKPYASGAHGWNKSPSFISTVVARRIASGMSFTIREPKRFVGRSKRP